MYAYPNFIGYGYSKCLTCHYNPYGNGPLTDYGRGLSATTISDRILHSSEKSEEQLAENSGFLYMKEFKSWVRPSVDYRGLSLDRNINTDDQENQFINMQGDLNLVLRYKGENNLFTSITYGYAPVPESLEDQGIEEYRTREHYIGWRPNDDLGLYVGLMDKVYGIRIADHIAFSRTITALTQNDQTHGLMGHYIKEDHELGAHLFIGNLVQDEELRQKGISIKYENEVSYTFKPGLSFLKSQNDYFVQENMSVHSKLAFSKGSSLLIEVGQAKKTNDLNKTAVTSSYLMMQNHMYLRRGLLFFVNTDYLKPNNEIEVEVVRLGPGLQYFLSQGIELRLDLFNTKTYTPGSVTKDAWDSAMQVHLWF